MCFFFGSARRMSQSSFFLVLQFLAYRIHDVTLYCSILLSFCIAALCALHSVFFHPHVVHMCCILDNVDKYWPLFVVCGNREASL